MSEQQIPAEYAWIKPGTEAVWKGLSPVVIASMPNLNGGEWMALIKGDKRPITLTIPVYCSELEPSEPMVIEPDDPAPTPADRAAAVLREVCNEVAVDLSADRTAGELPHVVLMARAILKALANLEGYDG